MCTSSHYDLAVLKKPLQTSIAVEADEFDDIDVEDKLHIVISVKDFRAIIQHAGITGNTLSARYSLPSRPIQLSYSSDAISCEFLIMTVGERGTNPTQKTRKGRKNASQNNAPRLEAISRRTSVAPSEGSQAQALAQPKPELPQQSNPPPLPTPGSVRLPPKPTPRLSAARASASRIGAFDLRPSQMPPPPTLRSESLFVEDEGWEPVRDEDEDGEEDARLEWNHSADPVSLHLSFLLFVFVRNADSNRIPRACVRAARKAGWISRQIHRMMMRWLPHQPTSSQHRNSQKSEVWPFSQTNAFSERSRLNFTYSY